MICANKRKLIILACAILVFFAGVSLAEANIFINLVAVNASEKQEKETPIKYYLPHELDPAHIVNTGGLKLDYDLDRSQYYLSGSVTLGPKESKTIKVEVKDVWRITPQEVDILKNQIDENLAMLQGQDLYPAAEAIASKMKQKLDFILSQQDNYSDNVERRIEEYRAYKNDIDKIRKNAFSINFFKEEAAVPPEKGKTVRFVIEVQNPSEKDVKEIDQKHYLPKEVRAEDIINRQGFDVRYDAQKDQIYLSRKDEFQPGETKRYVIEMKDIWHVPIEKVASLRERTEKILEGMKDSEYEDGANYIGNQIFEMLSEIENSQSDKQNMRKYIGAFRINQDRFVKVEDDIKKIELLLARVKAKKLEELEKSKVKNILQKLKSLRGIASLSEAIFGKKPTLTHTWKIIWGIMMFLAFFTTFHFFTWWRKAQVMGEDMALKAGGNVKEVKPAENPEGEEGEEKKKS